MTDPIYMPSPGGMPRRRRAFIPPLLLVPFLAYNLVAFLFLGGDPAGWNNQLLAVSMVSGTQWAITLGDLMIVSALVLLFFELLKSTRIGSVSIVDHMASMAVFVALLLEFLLVGAAASTVFFVLLVMSLIDVVAGFTMSITSATRDMSMQ